MNTITGATAFSILRKEPLRNSTVVDELDLSGDVTFPIHIEDCTIKSLYAPAAEFKESVTLRNCIIGNARLI